MHDATKAAKAKDAGGAVLSGLRRGLLFAWFVGFTLLTYGGLVTAVVFQRLFMVTLDPKDLMFSSSEIAVIFFAGLSGIPLWTGAVASLALSSHRTSQKVFAASSAINVVSILGVGALLGWQTIWIIALCSVPSYLGWLVLLTTLPTSPIPIPRHTTHTHE